MKSQAPQIYEILGPTPYKFMKSQHIQPTTLPHRSSSAPPSNTQQNQLPFKGTLKKKKKALKEFGEAMRIILLDSRMLRKD